MRQQREKETKKERDGREAHKWPQHTEAPNDVIKTIAACGRSRRQMNTQNSPCN